MVGTNAPQDHIDLAEHNVARTLGELNQLFSRIDLLIGAFAAMVLAGLALMQLTPA